MSANPVAAQRRRQEAGGVFARALDVHRARGDHRVADGDLAAAERGRRPRGLGRRGSATALGCCEITVGDAVIGTGTVRSVYIKRAV